MSSTEELTNITVQQDTWYNFALDFQEEVAKLRVYQDDVYLSEAHIMEYDASEIKWGYTNGTFGGSRVNQDQPFGGWIMNLWSYQGEWLRFAVWSYVGENPYLQYVEDAIADARVVVSLDYGLSGTSKALVKPLIEGDLWIYEVALYADEFITPAPTFDPTSTPTSDPTSSPSQNPTPAPTRSPTIEPSA